MTASLLAGRSRKTPVTDLAARLDAVQEVLDAGGTRLEPAARARAEQVVARTGERLALGLNHTVVAFAGATGSGKSSLFNALCESDVSTVGARRPTTSKATGLVVGAGGDELLDWLSVPRRHRLEVGAGGLTRIDGLVLLDLPDHDSTAVAHRLEVDRLVKLVDLMVWVVDPQKYADDALHTGYLQPLAAHSPVMTVVLNQIDRLAPENVEPCVADLRRLLSEDGLTHVPVLPVSARTGEGLDALRTRIYAAVDAHEAVKARVLADLSSTADDLTASLGATELDPGSVPGARTLVDSLVAAAGVPTVLRAVGIDHRRAAHARTGWPFTRWVSQLRRNPLRRLRLGVQAGQPQDALTAGRLDRSSLPAAGQGQRAQVALATRQIAAECSKALPARWQDAVREAALPPGNDVADALDRAVTGVDLRYRTPLWWLLFAGLQLLLAIAVVAGGLWLGALALMDYFRLPLPATPTVWLVTPEQFGVPLPTAMAVGGVLLGVLLAVVARPLAAFGAIRRQRKVGKALRRSVEQVGQALVLDPVAGVLADHRRSRVALARVSGGAGTRRR